MKQILLILLSSVALAIAGGYPLQTCVVSGEKLGEMGAPYVFEYQGTEVRLCCKDCREKFDKNPDNYLGKITGAAKHGNETDVRAASSSAAARPLMP